MLDVAATIDALVDRPSDTVLLCDYDGSLAPIVDLPDDAVALPEAIEVLGTLVGRLARVGIVSGRPVEFLAIRLPVPGLLFAALMFTVREPPRSGILPLEQRDALRL